VSRPPLPRPYAVVRNGDTESRFYLADCIQLLERLTTGSVDVIVTSPPYNLGIQYASYQDALPRAEYLAWTRAWVTAATRVLASEGSFFLNVGARPSDPWTAFDVAQEVRGHLRLQNLIHWVKSIAIEKDSAGAGARLDRDLAVGHYKPINSERFLNDCHEFLFHFTPTGATRLDRLALGVPYQDPSNIGRWRAAADGVRCRGNTWFIPYETIQHRDKDRPHPASFPSRLPEQCLRLHGLSRIGTVMDPFAGLGSTAVACMRLGLNFIGTDIDESYLKEAVERARRAARQNLLPTPGTARMRKADFRKREARRLTGVTPEPPGATGRRTRFATRYPSRGA
jgi:site-specific DNA-methyltransferase (adenine-specific)